ncbi:MAG: hypothetical protein B1H04_02310 [Planctomycetales bacterium 4484_123]|nr:MAG: hypothetical protein B1H04_02310 [Planctomycetales bacterium 4484_123]
MRRCEAGRILRKAAAVVLLAAALAALSARAWAQAQQPPGGGAGGSGAAGSVAATAPKSKGPLVTNLFYETSLRQVLSDIATQTKVVIVPDASVRGVVTCELKDVPLERALEMVLAGTGFVVKKMPGYYLVCSADLESPSFPQISETRVVRLHYVEAEAAAKMLSVRFRPYVQADAKASAVCVTAPQHLVERIVADLKLIDRPPRHVMLEARIVVMERSDLLNLGLQWSWPQVRAGIFSDSAHHGGGSRPNWPWGLQIGYTPGQEFTNSLVLTLNLLAQNDEATVVACPKLMVQDGREAEIRVNTEEYFEITSEGVYVTSRLEKIETGTVLKITPRIGQAGDITLEIGTEVSNVVARGENNLPVVTRRTASSTVRIKDGGTAALAGLMDSRSRLAKSDVPGLAQVPLLGYLFRHESGNKSARQVAVFVTARVMPEKPPKFATTSPRAPVGLVGEEFKAALRQSLRRLAGWKGKP